MPKSARFDFETTKRRYLATVFECYEGDFEAVLPQILAQLEFARRVVDVLLSPAGEALRAEHEYLLI